MIVKSTTRVSWHRRVSTPGLAVAFAALAALGAAPAVAADPAPEPRVVVESAQLLEASSLGTWFGGAARPVLTLELYNNGQAAFTPILELEWRDGNAPVNAVEEPELEEIPPGTRVTVEVPVQFNNFAQGQHTVSGVVRAGGRESAVEASTRLVPWGLYGFLVVALLAGAALRSRWAMTQLDRDDVEDVDDQPAPSRGPAPLAVADVAATTEQAPAPAETTETTETTEVSLGSAAEVEARALAAMERFAVTRERQAAESSAEEGRGVAVPQQRAPSGGRRAERSRKPSTPWLTRR